MFSLKILFENACHGAVAPKGVPKCQICCVLGLCFRAFPFFIPFLPSHSLSHTSSLSYFSPPLAFPKEVNKKLSYRGLKTKKVKRPKRVACRPSPRRDVIVYFARPIIKCCMRWMLRGGVSITDSDHAECMCRNRRVCCRTTDAEKLRTSPCWKICHRSGMTVTLPT